jgi:hypothetical protein
MNKKEQINTGCLWCMGHKSAFTYFGHIYIEDHKDKLKNMNIEKLIGIMSEHD